MRVVTPSVDYIRKLYAAQDALLSDIDARLRACGMPIHIGPDEGKLLQLLIRLHGSKRIVEIGTLAGYSTIWMARALEEDGHIYTLNKDPQHIKMAQASFAASEVRQHITMLEGDAHATLPQLADKAPFDMVFIDADKISYNDYLDWAENNVRKGGLVVADNTLLFGTVTQDTPPKDTAPATWQAMRRFNERLADPQRYFATILPTEEGLSAAIKLF